VNIFSDGSDILSPVYSLMIFGRIIMISLALYTHVYDFYVILICL